MHPPVPLEGAKIKLKTKISLKIRDITLFALPDCRTQSPTLAQLYLKPIIYLNFIYQCQYPFHHFFAKKGLLCKRNGLLKWSRSSVLLSLSTIIVNFIFYKHVVYSIHLIFPQCVIDVQSGSLQISQNMHLLWGIHSATKSHLTSRIFSLRIQTMPKTLSPGHKYFLKDISFPIRSPF